MASQEELQLLVGRLTAVENDNQQLRILLQAQAQVNMADFPALAGRAAAEALSHQTGQVTRLVEALEGQIQTQKNQKRSLLDTRTLGRPSVFKSEDSLFPEWASKMEDYITSIESTLEPIFDWILEQELEIVDEMIEAEFGELADKPIDNIGYYNGQFKTLISSLTEGEAFSIARNCKKSGMEAWRRLHKRFDPASGGRRRVLLKAVMNPNRVDIKDLGKGLEAWENLVARYNKKQERLGKPVLDDDVKISAVESLVPEDVEKHLSLNASRMKDYDTVRTEIVNYFETETGRASKISVKSHMASTTNQAAPMEIDALTQAVASLMKGKGKGKSPGKGKASGKGKSPGGANDGGCFVCGKKGHRAIDCWQAGKGGQGSGAKGGKSGKGGKQSSVPRNYKFEGYCDGCGKYGHKKSECWHTGAGGKAKGKAKAKGKGGKSVRGLDAEEEGEPEAEVAEAETGSLEIMSLDTKKISDHLYPGGYVKLNYDTGAAVTGFPRAFAQQGAKSTGLTMITASGEMISDDGNIQLDTRDEDGVQQRIEGTVGPLHKILASASRINKRGRRMSILDGEGGYIIPERSPIAVGLKREFRRLLKKHGRKSLIKLYLEKGVYNFYLKVQDVKAVNAVDGGSEVVELTDKKNLGTGTAQTGQSPREPPPPPPHAEPRPRRTKDKAGDRAASSDGKNCTGCLGCVDETCTGKDSRWNEQGKQSDVPGVDYYPFHRQV